MNKGLISIIIPVYNVENYLDRCLESIVGQTCNNIEIILVDDGSIDASGKICDAWAHKDSRIKVIHKKNEGLGYARNSGMEIATGEFLAFVDSDDYIKLNMYEKLYNKAMEYNADIVYCGMLQEKPNGSYMTISDFTSETIFEDKKKIKELSLTYFHANEGAEKIMSVWHSIYRAKVITTNFYSERDVVSEDLHFQLSAILNSDKIVYIPENLYYYCYNNASLTKTYKFEKFYGFQKLTKILIDLYPDKIPIIYKFFYNQTLGQIRQMICNKKISSKVKMEYLKKIYYDSIWKDVKQKSGKELYTKVKDKLLYRTLGENSFCIFYIFIKILEIYYRYYLRL